MNCILAIQKCPIRNEYSIHGLWMGHNQNPTCAFTTETLSDGLLHRLREVWYSCPSISSNGNDSFWKHEYCKHGKEYFPTAEEYFTVALQAFDFVMENIDIIKVSHAKEAKIPLVYRCNRFYYRLKF